MLINNQRVGTPNAIQLTQFIEAALGNQNGGQ